MGSVGVTPVDVTGEEDACGVTVSVLDVLGDIGDVDEVLVASTPLSGTSVDDASTSGFGAKPGDSVVSTASVEATGSVERLLQALTKSA
jgi:hypothetical protein